MATSAHRPLTARGVKMMLSRAGIGYSSLDIHDGGPVRTGSQAGKPSHAVIIEGPKQARLKAFWPLFDRGLAHAPYPDHDEWFRS